MGKTTVARLLLGRVESLVEKPKFTIAQHGVAAGHYAGATFDGADTVPYNGAAQVLDLWRQLFKDRPFFLLDGDRFSNANCLNAVRAEGVRVVVAHLDASTELLAERRKRRGSTQSESWMAGRATKAKRFAEMFPESDRLYLFADSQPEVLSAAIRTVLLSP